jgi:hypothetical protein
MQISKSKVAAAAAILSSVLAGPAFAQQAGLFAYHTKAIGGCPAMDWHITVEPSGQLVGFVGWGDHLAKLAGQLKPNRSFEMNAQEIGGQGRTAAVKGTATGEYITAVVSGTSTACDGQPVQVPRASAGMAGGGG